jgi:hypothetical protein
MLALAVGTVAQDPAAPVSRKLKRHGEAYDKAVAYLRQTIGKARFQAKMIVGFLWLADGRFPEDLAQIVEQAKQWDRYRKNIQHAQNWYPALAGALLAEVYKFTPSDDLKEAMQGIVDEFVKTQEKTGGWFKWYEGAVKDMPKYPVRDLGFLDCMVYGFLLSARKHGCKVPETTIQNGDRCLQSILGPGGVSYGTGQRGGDTTGARGAFAMLGLENSGNKSHPIWTTYAKIMQQRIPSLDKGHHIGGLHAMGVALGCRLLGLQGELLNQWGAKLAAKQDAEGGLYVGDDGADGGEPGLFGSNHASTAAFAMILLLQEPGILNPKAKGPGKPSPAGKSPFSQKK